VCGFVGVVRAPGAGPATAAEVERFFPWLRRRGPDGVRTFVEGGIALAASRLAIQGGRESDQPLLSADGRFVLAYNGELFASHRRALRGAIRAEGGGEARATSDTALLLAWLAHRLVDRRAGEPLPAGTVEPLLGGMYAFALVDRREREVVLHGDGAIKPLHAMERGALRETWFSSTLSPLLSLERGRLSVDAEEWAYRLVSPAGSRTLFSGVPALRRVAPRVVSVLEATAGTAPRTLLERPSPPPAPAGPADADDLRAALFDAAREAAETRVAPSVFLSGGLDSAAVLAGCRRRDALAITGRFAPRAGPFDESEEAALVARAAGVRHEVLDLSDRDLLLDLPAVVEALEEPAGGPGSLALHRVARRARAHGPVALSGTGGDERLGGYARIALALGRGGRFTEGYEGLAAAMDAAGTDPIDRWVAAVDRGRDLLPWLDPAFRAAFPAAAARARATDDLFGAATARPGAPSALRALVSAEERTTLAMLLTVEDRVTMALGLESRPVPCLGRVGATARRLPDEALVGPDGEGKRALREGLLGSIPEAVRADARKRGFPTPFHRAATGEGRDLAEAVLSDRRFRERGWWDVAACRRLLDEPRPAHDRALFAVLVHETWARRFLDGEAFEALDAAVPGAGAAR
jgi:asparagine synthase (glutamine-hydrolysing)